jgi:hypothetical protein
VPRVRRYTVRPLYSALAIQCTRYTVRPLYSAPAIQCARYTVHWLYSAPAIQCARYTVRSLYSALAIDVQPTHTVAPLHRWIDHRGQRRAVCFEFFSKIKKAEQSQCVKLSDERITT